MESLDYYRRLEVMEIERDLFKAVAGRCIGQGGSRAAEIAGNTADTRKYANL